MNEYIFILKKYNSSGELMRKALYFKNLEFDFDKKLKFNLTVVKWIGEYDIWNHSDPNVLPFQYGLRTENLHPKSPFALNKWRYLLTSNNLSTIIPPAILYKVELLSKLEE